MSYQQIATVVLFSACLGSLYSTSPLLAQVTPDQTLGNETSVVTPNLNIKDTPADLIEGGAIRENNLFHSFAEFNIPNGHNIYFASPEGIANILTRVTGNNISEVFGTLGVDGAANLFLLNPNGIVFGEDAVLDVNGSFFATTANSYIFENDFAYSATNSDAPPLLTVNIPVGIQFADRAETIVVETQSLNLNEEFNLPIGVTVPPGKNITLVGGDLEFKGTNLSAPNGKINLGSVAPNSLVEIVPTDDDWALDYGKVSTFQDISLTQETLIDSSGDGTGKIEIQADSVQVESSFIYADALEMGDAEGIRINVKTLSLWDDAGIASNTLSEGDSGNISIQADSVQVESSFISSESLGDTTGNGGDINFNVETLSLLGGTEISSDSSNEGDSGNISIQADSVEVKSSFISSDSFRDIAGNGGDINLNVGTLSLLDGTEISSDSISEGDAGNISIQADSVEVKSSFISSDSFADTAGKGGDINLNVGTLSLLGGATISSDTLSENDAGDIYIQADSLEIEGANELGSGSISSRSHGIGKGGDINFNVGTLRLIDYADISSSTSSAGDAGDISIQADSVEVKSSFISSDSFADMAGNGGDIDLKVGTLSLLDYAAISSDTFSEGDAGNISIQADSVEVKSSFISSDSFADMAGKGGDINLKVGTLNLIDYAAISSDTLSESDAGDISIQADFLEVKSSFISTDSLSDRAGNGGDIDLKIGTISLLYGANISSSTSSEGDAGNIFIQANSIELKGGNQETYIFGNPQYLSSGIFSSAREENSTGNGGTIDINVTEVFNIIDGGKLQTNTDGFGNAGNITVDAFLLNVSGSGVGGDESLSQISALSGKDGDSGSIAINSNTLHISDRGNISVSNLGNGNSGSLNITTSQLYLDDFATIEAKVSKGSQGNIQLTTDNIFLNNHSEITVLATGSAMGGNLDIDNAENIVLLENSQIIADSIEGNGGNININTQGYFISADSSISASSDFGLDGNIEVETINGDRTLELAALPNNPINGTEKITAGCNSQNNFAIAGKGGLPPNPNEYLRGQAVWQDLRLLGIDSIKMLERDFQKEITPSESPIEANDWKINNLGKVELIVGNSSDIASKNNTECSLWN